MRADLPPDAHVTQRATRAPALALALGGIDEAIATRLTVRVIRDIDAWLALQPQWDALWQRAAGTHQQAFNVCRASWQRVAQPRGQRLRIIAVFDDTQLVLAWPMVVERQLCWSMLRPLTPGTAEHTAVLAESGSIGLAATARAWQAAKHECGADVLMLPYVADGTMLNALARADRGLLVAVEGEAWTARLRGESDWDVYRKALGGNNASRPGARERRLAKEGALTFRAIGPGDTADHPRWVDWLLERKRDWAEQTTRRARWLQTEGYRQYLLDILSASAGPERAEILAVMLDGEPIAAGLMGVASTSVTGILTTFEAQFAKFGPGIIAVERTVRWALERDKDFDLGVGSERFKSFYCRDRADAVCSFEVAATAWGRIAVPAKHAWYWIDGKRQAMKARAKHAQTADAES